MSGIPSSYLIGEWFVGAILILYFLFPFLYRLIRSFPLQCAVILAAAQIAFFVFLPENVLNRPADTLALLRVPDFCAGIYLGIFFTQRPSTHSYARPSRVSSAERPSGHLYTRLSRLPSTERSSASSDREGTGAYTAAGSRISSVIAPAAAAVLLAALLFIPMKPNCLIVITLTGLCMMIVLIWAGQKTEQLSSAFLSRVRAALSFFSACSFPFFLLHHQLLLIALELGSDHIRGTGSFILFSLITFAAVLFFAVLIQKAAEALHRTFHIS